MTCHGGDNGPKCGVLPFGLARVSVSGSSKSADTLPAHCLSCLTYNIPGFIGHPSGSHLPAPFTVHDIQSSHIPPILV